jgi:hypothetical protein
MGHRRAATKLDNDATRLQAGWLCCDDGVSLDEARQGEISVLEIAPPSEEQAEGEHAGGSCRRLGGEASIAGRLKVA